MRSFCAAAFLVCSTAFAGVVQPLQSAPQLLIPAAGSTPGVNGTFWRSDIAIANFNDRQQLVRVQWLPQGASSTFSKTITLEHLSFVRSNDFVAEILNHHITFELECIDRMYLNVYVPALQCEGGRRVLSPPPRPALRLLCPHGPDDQELRGGNRALRQRS